MTTTLLAAAVLATFIAQDPPDLETLIERGLENQQRLETEAASWTAVHTLSNGAVIRIAVISDKDRRALTVTLDVFGQTQEVARIIERDGAWYAKDSQLRGKYRPFEAPFAIPGTYLYLDRSEILVYDTVEVFEGARYQGQKEGRAEWRFPFPESRRKMLQGFVRNSEALLKRIPKERQATLVRGLKDLRAILEKGLPVVIELETGFLMEYGSPKLMTRIEGFRFLDSVPDDAFDLGQEPWPDRSNDPTTGNRDDLTMIGHTMTWRPGGPSPDLNLCLMDVKTGTRRRVPYMGSTALGGSFSKDRTRVYVAGHTMEGTLSLFEVNLSSGENRPLAMNLDAGGIMVGGAVSPDGKTLVAGEMISQAGEGIDGLLNNRIVLVDVSSGEGRYVGKPLPAAFFSWFPDGKHILLVKRERADLDSTAVPTVCRMDLEGNLTAIIPGERPAIVRNGTRILYEDTKENHWYTCDLEGKGREKLGNGFARHSFMAPSPDGMRILMMRFQAGKAPTPVILDLETMKSRVLTQDPGFWATPVWR